MQVGDAVTMGRIALLLLLVASPAFAQPAPAPPPAPPPPAPPPTAPPPTAPALQRAKCQSNLYLEPTLLVGRSRKDGIGRLHGAGGFRYSRCPTDGPESFRVHLGFFVQVGSEEVGDAFTKGGELEYNTPFREGRIGGRAYYGTANHGLYIIGGGVRFRRWRGA